MSCIVGELALISLYRHVAVLLPSTVFFFQVDQTDNQHYQVFKNDIDSLPSLGPNHSLLFWTE